MTSILIVKLMSTQKGAKMSDITSQNELGMIKDTGLNGRRGIYQKGQSMTKHNHKLTHRTAQCVSTEVADHSQV